MTPAAAHRPKLAGSPRDTGTSFSGERCDVLIDDSIASESSRSLAAIHELVSLVSSAPDLDRACQLLADELASYLGARVTVGICRTANARCVIRATSDLHDLDPSLPMAQLATHALEEAIAREAPSSWPNSDKRDQHSLRALKQYFESARRTEPIEAVMAVPLKDESGLPRGACLLSFTPCDANALENSRRFLHGATPMLASAIGLLQRAEGNYVDQAVRQLRQFRECNKSRCVLGLAVALTILLLIPVPYRVKCDCELQPVVRRFVAAPFGAQLEKNFAEPGDIVTAGDVLARIDGREIRWELSATEAELHRAVNERDGRLAAKKSGETKIAALEVERLQVSLEQLQHRISQLEIRAPISGIVVTGDHSKSEGVPLQAGQVLYEIAPLDDMIVEVYVPERELRFIEEGMLTKVVLDAFPDVRTSSPIKRIHPRAELIDHENVFVVELELRNASKRLRPGMQGTAKIATSKRPLGWILFHMAIEACAIW